MKNYVYIIPNFILLVFFWAACKGPTPPPAEHSLTVSISPSNAGKVNPSGGTYDDGSKLSLMATANSGWEFTNWSGSGISSTDNPTTITMNSDRSIIANFSEISDQEAEAFTINMTVSDGQRSDDLILISSEDSGINEELDANDKEGPPIAPPNAFFVGSITSGMNLLTDVRPASESMVWKLRLNRALTDDMELAWTIDNAIEGELKLVDNPDDSTPNVEIDMSITSSYSVSDQSIQSLYVVYSVSENKLVTDLPDREFEEFIEEKIGDSPEDELDKETKRSSMQKFKREN